MRWIIILGIVVSMVGFVNAVPIKKRHLDDSDFIRRDYVPLQRDAIDSVEPQSLAL